MIIFKEILNYKDFIPTYKFYLMLKIKMNNEFWDKKFEIMLEEIRDEIKGSISYSGEGDKTVAIKGAMEKFIEKIAVAAWRTIPSSFLSGVGIPRVLHH
jgi:hypothetical protein